MVEFTQQNCPTMLQTFWKWLVDQVPLWWAPNAITFAGLAFIVGTTTVLMLNSPNGTDEVRFHVFNVDVL